MDGNGMTTTFDFDDGNGEVPARRHINPDGSVGGWVAKTAFVEGSVYLEEDSVVFDNAIVKGYVSIYYEAKIYGNALIFDNAQVHSGASVYGNAKIYGNAVICDNDVVIYDEAHVFGDAIVYGKAKIYGSARIYDTASVYGNVHVYGNTGICGNQVVFKNTHIVHSKTIQLSGQNKHIETKNAPPITTDVNNILPLKFLELALIVNRGIFSSEPNCSLISADIQDGNGLVNFRRHENLNGDLGGWVADSATVSITSYIGKDVLVFQNATITENVHIYEHACIYGNAKITGDVKIGGMTHVYGNASIFGNVIICGNPLIYGYSVIYGCVQIVGNNWHFGIFGSVWIHGKIIVYGDSLSRNNVSIYHHYNQNNCKIHQETRIEMHNRTEIFDQLVSDFEYITSTPSTSFKIPPPPEPLQFNSERVIEIKTESKKVSAMLDAIYEKSSSVIETPRNAPQSTSSSLNLDATHLEIVKILATRHQWGRSELQPIMKGMMIDGVMEHINDAFFNYCDEAFIEGNDPIEINVELYKDIFK